MTTTKLREEFVAALQRGAPPGELAGIVLQHKERGLSQQAAYDTLQSVWIELGCQVDDDNPVCETLGDIMDRVWGFCSPRLAIWDSSLPEVPGQ